MGPIIRTCSRLIAGALLAGAPAPAMADVPASLSAYVRARAADADGRAGAAAAGYAIALASTPGDPVIAVRAYRQALNAGDDALAVRAAAALVAAKAAPADVAIVQFAAALRARDMPAVDAGAAAIAEGPLDFLMPTLRAWLTFDARRGDWMAMLKGATGSALGRRFATEHRALLLIADGRRDEGLAVLRTLPLTDAGDLRAVAAELLACTGDEPAARDLLGGSAPIRGACTKPDAAYGASRLFTRLSGEIAESEARPLAIVLARAALMLDAGDDRARLVLAQALSGAGADDEALAVLAAAKPSDDKTAMQVEVLAQAGRTAAAIEIARQGTSAEDAQRLGDLLVAAGRFEDAAAAYGDAIARAGDGSNWTLYLQQGGALEQAGKWAEALPLLERAAALAPDEPVVLNYLGYAQVERGENLVSARVLIEKAARLQPDDASITDSLGWAWFRAGDTTRALPLLERAAQARPGSAVVNEHLGDAYWAVGRRYEARYAWRAAALAATGNEAARIAAKLGS